MICVEIRETEEFNLFVFAINIVCAARHLESLQSRGLFRKINLNILADLGEGRMGGGKLYYSLRRYFGNR